MDCTFATPRRCALALTVSILMWVASTPRSDAIPQQPGPAAAGAASVPQVTVTAPRPATPAELAGDSIPNFLIAHARPSPASGQLAVWKQPVCAAVLGLTPAFNSFVSERIAAVADSVGAPHGATGCKPNVHIFFTTDPQTIADAVAKQLPEGLGFHYVSETRKLATLQHPIEGWYATATEGDKGAVQLDEPTEMNSQFRADLSSGILGSPTPPARLGTRLTTGRTSLLVHALVLVDLKKVAGREIGPISDYLAMLVLSQTRQQDACGQLPSILDLMAPTCDREKPTAVTAGDLAFLRALYKTDLRTNYYMESGSINARMSAELARH
jgi:hypothetical protein